MRVTDLENRAQRSFLDTGRNTALDSESYTDQIPEKAEDVEELTLTAASACCRGDVHSGGRRGVRALWHARSLLPLQGAGWLGRSWQMQILSLMTISPAIHLPGRLRPVRRSRGDTVSLHGQQFPAEEPTNRCLSRALGEARVLSQFTVTDRDWPFSPLFFANQPNVNEEGCGTAVVPHLVTHERIENVIV